MIGMNGNNLQYFRIEGLQILIEFLYKNIRNTVATIALPPFVIFSIALGYYIFLNIQYRDLLKIKSNGDKSEDQFIQQTDQSKNMRLWFQTYNFMWLAVCMFYLVIALTKLKIQGWKRYFLDPSEVTDIVLCLLGFTVFSLVQNAENSYIKKN